MSAAADRLRTQMIAAIATGAAIASGCRGGEASSGSGSVTVPAQPAPRPSTTATVSAPPPVLGPVSDPALASASASASGSASASASASASPSASASARPTSCGSFKKETFCFEAFKKSDGPILNPHRDYDKKGCLPDSQVAESCSGITGVVSGPTKQGNKCCYVVCQGPVPPCGRPLFADDGAMRLATIAPAVRGAIPARDTWLRDAAMEHASIFSFARFVLELQAIGAPARFVEDARQAGLDEIEHTRLCLAMASRVDPDGAAFTPSEIALDGITIRADLSAIAASAADEACVGETYSTLVASERCEREIDPIARAVLAKIADDEARHAALGFRFVAWAIAEGGPRVADAVHDAMERSLARLGDAGAATRDARAIVADALRLLVDTRTRTSLDRPRSHGKESAIV